MCTFTNHVTRKETIMRLISNALLVSSTLFSLLACGQSTSTQEASDDVATSAEALIRQPSLDDPPLQFDPGLIGTAGVGGGPRPPSELKPCTNADRDTCQQCQDDCQAGICSTNQGDDRAGGCVGSFCPTRCDVCVLSCSQVRSCVRCFGR
jgi:hypothetical protein